MYSIKPTKVILHLIDCLNENREFETNGFDYLKSLAVQEAIYQSSIENNPIEITY